MLLVTRMSVYPRVWGSLFFGFYARTKVFFDLWARVCWLYVRLSELGFTVDLPYPSLSFSVRAAGGFKYPPAVVCPERERGHEFRDTINGKGVIIASVRSDRGWKNASHARSSVTINALVTGAVERAHRAAAEQPGVSACLVPLP